MRPLALALLLLLAAPVRADVYRWTDDKGVVHYTDKPPTKDAKPVDLPKLQTYKPAAPTETPAADAAAEDAVPAKAGALRIASPQNEETIRDIDGKVSIVVSAEVQPGQGLVYYLDGKAQNPEPTPSTGYLLSGVERGEHQIAVALVDADGRELSRSEAVTVFLMQPTVRKR